MTLLTSMLERPLDPGYRAAADDREAAGLPPATSTRTPFVLVSLLVIGIIIGASAAHLRSRDGVRAATRAELVRQIESHQGQVDERAADVRRLQGEVDEAAAAADPGAADEEGLEQLRSSTGVIPVTGPGLRVTLDDAPGGTGSADGNPRTGEQSEGRVQSRDLQLVTNGLWAAGAEAIAINGQRLTSTTAIRFAGDAILVNFRPLTRPYVVEAVGDKSGMQTRFAAGPAGAYLNGLRQNFGIPTSLTTQDSLTLPSAVNVKVERSAVVPAGRPAPAERPVTVKESSS